MVQELSINKFHKNYELTNVISGVHNTLKRNGYGNRDINNAINQILSLIGYKYLSENAENNNDDLGYELNEEYYYKNLLMNKAIIVDLLKAGIEQITQENKNPQATNVFHDIFTLVDFNKFPENETWILFTDLLEYICSNTTATLGNIFNFITQYSTKTKTNIKKLKATEILTYYTTIDKKEVENLYDPNATNGSLMVNIGNEINVKNYYGQHDEFEKYVLAKFNLLVNNVNYKNIFITHNGINNMPSWSNQQFDLCATIPPFGKKVLNILPDDERFKPYSPKKTPELAYLLDMMYNIDENGTVALIVPDGILFKGGLERKIMKHLVDNQFISSIIALPTGIFDESAVPTAIMILDKKPKEEIFYLNLRNRSGDDNKIISSILLDNYEKYLSIAKKQEEIESISYKSTLEEIQENDYNLAINRYVNQEKIEVIDMEKTMKNIENIKIELKQLDEELNAKMGDLIN